MPTLLLAESVGHREENHGGSARPDSAIRPRWTVDTDQRGSET
jgi:hypothetical protein